MKKLTLILLCSMLLSFTLPGCVVTDENGNTFMFLPDLDIDDGPHGPPSTSTTISSWPTTSTTP